MSDFGHERGLNILDTLETTPTITRAVLCAVEPPAYRQERPPDDRLPDPADRAMTANLS